MFADGGYAGPKLRGALVDLGRSTLQIIKRSNTKKGFEVLPRGWVVERTFAWLGRLQRRGRRAARCCMIIPAVTIAACLLALSLVATRMRGLARASTSPARAGGRISATPRGRIG